MTPPRMPLAEMIAVVKPTVEWLKHLAHAVEQCDRGQLVSDWFASNRAELVQRLRDSADAVLATLREREAQEAPCARCGHQQHKPGRCDVAIGVNEDGGDGMCQCEQEE